MDILILVIFILVIFLTMRRGFVMSIVNFFKGFVSLIVAWLFCDNLADWLITKTEIGVTTIDRINHAVSSRWESSDIYMALPDMLKDGSGSMSTALIADGAEKLAAVLLTIVSFAFIVLFLRLVLSIVGLLFSHKNNKGFAGAVDWIMGLLLGVILGLIYVFLFLALLVPLLGLFMPEQCSLVMSWLDSSFVAGDLYNNNLLLIIFRDFVA